jgi:drug/metabolite transporter (DMT)-like permease
MENAAHQHLLVNHFPIVAAVLAIPIALMALLLRRERGLLLAAVFLLVVSGLGGWIAYSTGEDAMEMFENSEEEIWYETYQEADVGEHEERAETTVWVATAAAVIGVVVLFLAHRRPPDNPLPRYFVLLVLVGALATSATMAWTADAGGVVMHPEIRPTKTGK